MKIDLGEIISHWSVRYLLAMDEEVGVAHLEWHHTSQEMRSHYSADGQRKTSAAESQAHMS